ncbi:hypothetical protein ITP53_43750 [Nonomuraea sp. K274]|uniref:DUF6398 domain-containing protein n=1 Tax=Nonomuraea cypriaca TaxID=1187855 RepID=A0A931AP77_9ACTN|nr:DUF6398 domain-containing protein [Nonomuraea cypriaca]MBF8192482.1 hypothetical protein [Nonomuraea cypriaca]
MTKPDELKIPNAMRQISEEIIALTQTVCAELLDEEYAGLARRVIAALARKRPSPLVSGTRRVWAAGVVYALGQTNFLFDPSTEPYRTADELSSAFGVSKSAMGAKAKQIRDTLKMSWHSPEWQHPDMLARNPAIWFVLVDGLMYDARELPVEIQFEAYRQGVIPYVPALGPAATPPRDTV